MYKYKEWIVSFIFVAVVLLSLTALFNFFVDSNGIFTEKEFTDKAAVEIVNGHYVAGMENYDERTFEKQLIFHDTTKYNSIVLGSSRSMTIRKKFFLDDNLTFFNHAVPGGSIEDYIAMIGMYKKIKGYIPSEIIIGIDPWLFNKNNQRNDWKTLANYYNFLRKEMFLEALELSSVSKEKKWKQLINYEYTMSNIKSYIKLLLMGGRHYYLVNNADVNDFVIDIDGSLHYPSKVKNIDEKVIKQKALLFLEEGNVYGLSEFNELTNTVLFEQFIDYLQMNNVKIVFFMHPYNPITYNSLKLNPKYFNLQHSEEYIRRMAKEKTICVLGSFDPSQEGFSSEDFFDGMHGHETVSKKILKHYNECPNSLSVQNY
jgi:hypothetical protein